MNIGEIRAGITIILNKELFLVIAAEHAKLGRGSAFLRAKLKSLDTGKVIDKTLRDSDNVEQAYIEKRKLQFLYKDEPLYHFMDLETYESLILNKEKIDDLTLWLKENLELEGLFFEHRLISLQLPSQLTLKVAQTEPGFRGNTVKQGTKPAKLETGATVQVPLFINIGDIIKVNPESKEYLGRA
ncbi:MAG: elongation factor P [Candidatus Omnitrophica bacterium]|nr:elongation factor P [Candidatus Omnitrophota bacterium]